MSMPIDRLINHPSDTGRNLVSSDEGRRAKSVNRVAEHITAHQPDKEKVKYCFYTHWQLIQALGPLNTFALDDSAFAFETGEELMACFLLGAVWGLKLPDCDAAWAKVQENLPGW